MGLFNMNCHKGIFRHTKSAPFGHPGHPEFQDTLERPIGRWGSRTWTCPVIRHDVTDSSVVVLDRCSEVVSMHNYSKNCEM